MYRKNGGRIQRGSDGIVCESQHGCYSKIVYQFIVIRKKVERLKKLLSNSVVEFYFKKFMDIETDNENLPAGYIHYNPSALNENDCAIVGIQLLNKLCEPMKYLRTWDYVRFRIHYTSTHLIRHGSLELKIHTRDGMALMVCSTQPDSNISYEIKIGQT